MLRLSKTELSDAQSLESAVSKRRGYKSFTTNLTNILLAGVALVFLLMVVLFGYVPVSGTSMLPTLQEKGDAVIILKCGTVTRGDIVIVDNSDLKLHPEDKLLIKRVVAIQGDTVSYRQDNVGKLVLKVNGEVINEPYIKETLYLDDVLQRPSRVENGCDVKDGYVYVMGDNRLTSHDSRNFGQIELDRIVGKVIVIL